ncbi:MAG: hypothetical protein KC482_04265, partial [Dehalococcoidia bacterium]|nr:hypothetical protein [Dehalococcoidia bacterium]
MTQTGQTTSTRRIVAGERDASALAGGVADNGAVMRPQEDVAMEVRDLSLWYGKKQALTNVNLAFPKNKVTALIGPS